GRDGTTPSSHPRTPGASDTLPTKGAPRDRNGAYEAFSERCRERCDRALAVHLVLLAFDAFEQRAEVAGAEPLVPFALNELVEKGTRFGAVVVVCGVFQEDLQKVAGLPVAIH